MTKHQIVHIEFSSQDLDTAVNFYKELFGWEVEKMPEMNYATFDTGDGVGGGLNPVSEEYPAGMVIVYISTDDIDASLSRAESLGGKTVTPKTEIPGMGWFGLFSDPTGNIIGLFTSQ